MIYPYKCNTCGYTDEVVKPSGESARAEQCPMCQTYMQRIYTVPLFSIQQNAGYYHMGLGSYINKHSDVNNLLMQQSVSENATYVADGDCSVKKVDHRLKISDETKRAAYQILESNQA